VGDVKAFGQFAVQGCAAKMRFLAINLFNGQNLFLMTEYIQTSYINKKFRSRASFRYKYCIGQLEVFTIKHAPKNAGSTPANSLLSDCSTSVSEFVLSIIESRKAKHKHINGNAHLIILVSEIDCQGPSGVRNALALWNEFCRIRLQKFVDEFAAANGALWSECTTG